MAKKTTIMGAIENMIDLGETETPPPEKAKKVKAKKTIAKKAKKSVKKSKTAKKSKRKTRR